MLGFSALGRVALGRGRSSASGAALIAEAGAFVLAGQFIPIQAEAGSFVLTGADIGGLDNLVLSAAAGSVVLTGQNIGSVRTYLLLAESGPFVLTGAAVSSVSVRRRLRAFPRTGVQIRASLHGE